MGFNIWATGITGSKKKLFHYSKKDCLDQSDFEPNKVLSMLPSSPDIGGVAKKVVGTPSSHVGGATVKGMFALAKMEIAHMVAVQVGALKIHSSSGKISVYCEEEKWYWANSNSFVNFYLSSSNPGKDFIKKISPGLKKTDLNNFGVLAQIGIALSEYSLKLGDGVTPNISISLTH